ncbi:MAG: homocysteine S-methyltransferase [Planctomycetota bacterium]
MPLNPEKFELSTPPQIERILAANRPFILDGASGSEMQSRGYDVSSSLWSAQLLIDEPDALQALHLDYLQAGADCITTSSYQASMPALLERGFSLAELQSLFELSVSIAVAAREQFLQQQQPPESKPLVAASIGCFGAYLADGSEYRGNYGVAREVLVDFHRQRLHWLDQSGADLIACETIPDLAEAEVLAELLRSTNTPAWVSFSCADGAHLHDGSRIETMAELFNQHPGVFALGINCTAPGFIDDLVIKLKSRVPDKLILVYPNSGEQYDAEHKCWQRQESPQQWLALVEKWHGLGADMIGGCCRIGPEQIQTIANRYK